MAKSLKILIFLSCLSLVLLISNTLYAQDSLSNEKQSFGQKLVDTFIDKDINRWSIRALANFKDNRFSILNDDYTLEYYPNNRSGIGFGFLNSKLLVDIIFNLKTNKDEITERFDMQGDLMIGHSYILFHVQRYQGFNVKNVTLDDPSIFRRDIKTLTLNLVYFYIFNREVNTLSSIFSGVNRNYKSAGSFIGGSYLDFHRMEADSSIVPESSAELFNSEAHIVNYKQYGVGINFGYSYFFKLPANFLIALAAAPGAGLNFKNIDTETSSYNPSDIWHGSVTTNIQLAYNGPRIYVELSNINTWFFTSFDNNNRGRMNSTKMKLAIGYKLRKHDL
jgi:hypothetical protein